MRTLAELEQWSCELNDIQAEISGGDAAEYRSGLSVLGGVFSIGCCRETVCVAQEQQRSPFIRSHIKAVMEYIQFPGGGSGSPSEASS